MFRLIVVTLAALYGILHVYGADERRVEVSRQTTDGIIGLTFASFNIPELEQAPLSKDVFDMSEEEAIRLALEAGAKIREQRARQPLYGVVAAVDSAGLAATAPVAEEARAPMWYVTGSTVNLRAGPGTGNAVIGKVTFGEAAEVIDTQNGWYQIKTVDGTVSGWIFGKFLEDTRPG